MTEHNLHSRAFLNNILRQDLRGFNQRVFQTVCPGQTFLDNWHIQAYVHHLRECHEGRCTRLIINVPPRSLKSITVSVAFPAWILGYDPTARIICVSYSGELATKHARDCRRVMESAWYKAAFPDTRINPRKNTETELETTRGGGRLATSVGGTLTGRGGNYILIDDPMKPEDAESSLARKKLREWYAGTLYSRQDNKQNSVIIVVGQRLHQADLSGNLLETGDWTLLCLPAIADAPQQVAIGPSEVHTRKPGDVLHPEREPTKVLAELRRQMSEAKFSAQYQQDPVPPGGALIKSRWFHFYIPDELDRRDGIVVQSWDTANKSGELNDYSACTTWCFKRDLGLSYLLDVYRDRLDYPDLKKKVIDHAQEWGAERLLIEDIGSGTGLLHELRRVHLTDFARPSPVRPIGDKIQRMTNQTAKIEAGTVFFPEEAPWLPAFLEELLGFPQARHDDQVDSLSQYLNSVDEACRKTLETSRLRGR